MLIALHKQARTTPHVRAQIAASDEPVVVAGPPVWRGRADALQKEAAHRCAGPTAHGAPVATTLTPRHEAMVVYLRRTLLLPLDDRLPVTREFLCAEVSRSGPDRCLRWHGVGNLRALRPAPGAG